MKDDEPLYKHRIIMFDQHYEAFLVAMQKSVYSVYHIGTRKKPGGMCEVEVESIFIMKEHLLISLIASIYNP